MALAGPYFLAYCASGDAFDPTVHNRMDEIVFDFDLKIKEADKPLLVTEMLNPHIGLLNPSRQQWVWYSRIGANGHIYPFFHGRLMAVPTNMVGEMITVNFIAWPEDYFQQLQALAEVVRVNGPYDEVFIKPDKADDPDTILEAMSGKFCVDAITNVVTIEDFIEASDGNVNITGDDHFYDGFTFEIDQQAPLTSLLIDMSVDWDQTAIGYVDMGTQYIATYSGDGVINDWPKPLQQLGSGWSVFTALTTDVFNVRNVFTGSASYHWQSGEKTHEDGDTLSLSWNASGPVLNGPAISGLLYSRQQDGFLDPFGVDADGDPSPTNIPASSQSSSMYVPQFDVSTALTLRYQTVRPRTERILMLMKGDFQATVVDPLVTQYSETMKMTGRNVGYPIVNLLDWTTIAGQAIEEGTVVFPDLPTLPGGQSIQVCTTAGTAGTVQPTFSDIPGETTEDNDVVWASLGQNQPSDGNYPDWTAVTNVGLGTIIVPHQPLYIAEFDLVRPGLVQIPQVGVDVALGEIVLVGETYFACILDGITGVGSIFGGSAEWTSIGNVLPDGKTLFLATNVTGQTGALYVIPQFGLITVLHSTIVDGGVTWTNIGIGDIPAGGTIGNVWARSYFDQARGNLSLEYGISVGRAKMRLRGRAVKIGFDCPVDVGVGLSCRKTITIEDTRIPGGIAVGKVTLINFNVNGDRGEEICHVEIGCAIGFDNAVTQQPGTPTYADADYCGNDYQVFDDVVKTLPDLSDVGYTPPIAPGVDDGLVFPLDKTQVIVSEVIRGSLDDQKTAVNAAINAAAAQAVLSSLTFGSVGSAAGAAKVIAELNGNSLAIELQNHPIWYEGTIKPLNRPFSNVYRVQLTTLTMEKGVDLAGASTP